MHENVKGSWKRLTFRVLDLEMK